MAQALSFAVVARPVSAARTQVRRPRAAALVARSAKRSEIDLSDEYTAVESMASQDDLLLYYNHQHESRNTRLADVMQTNLILTTPETSLAEVTKLLDGPPSIEGLPVCNADKKLVGVISKKDLSKGGALVKDVMSTPPIALKSTGKVADAAVCMTEHKFHRVPVVDDDGVCVGIVTRSDIFWALTQADQEADEETPLSQHGLAL
jgi:CBS domain-containing protein